MPTLLDLNNALQALNARMHIARNAGATATAALYEHRLDRIQSLLRNGQGQAAYGELCKSVRLP